MGNENFNGLLGILVSKAKLGSKYDIDFIMSKLNKNSSLSNTRFVDYALSIVENPIGKNRILYYLHHGTLIQRNYASLYFNRRGDWKIVNEAYKKGLIDEIQAFAR